MLYSINLYARLITKESYESIGKIYLNCIPHKDERILFEKKIYDVEEVCYKIGYCIDTEINLYCIEIGKSNLKKTLIKGE